MSAARRRAALTLHELVLLAALAVVAGFLYWALVQGWLALQVAMGPFGDLAQNALAGGWMVVAPLAVFIIRKPGVGIVAEVVAALVEVVFLASPVGPMLILVGVVQGAGAELAFALTRYRRYGWGVFVLSGLTAAAANLAIGMVRFGWATQDWFALRVALQAVSGVVLCGLLARVTGEALLRTGVLDDHAVGRERLAAPAAPAGGGPPAGADAVTGSPDASTP
ncbi:ECF transporter S component [Cellulomonas chengniuliangii]|uniref:ECF transporter S component n=1 Tax=Cellulomonas chengniuliangii TaxID=2968084 RepID=A0ABY5L3H4_9CELL|nr:ECF transporter S component [Cellulomonas chengniuliangii]MCC2318216.1 ECF transporter S component [Cellulomonas chengniuliangii]UUI76398.1 ECF transporter S component [Cellulomonas chengniuliangii]